MSTSLQRLLPLFEHDRERGEPVVLATVLRTAGPTYTKPGAQMLIARSGEYAGLLSGGCLEGDLSERAARVLEGGACEIVRYDMRGPDDLLFGLGSGCEGAMDILLQPLDAATAWQPLGRLAAAWKAQRAERLLLVVAIDDSASADTATCRAGCGVFLDDGEPFGPTTHPPAGDGWIQALRRVATTLASGSGSRLLPRALPGMDLFLLEQAPPTRVLVLGAGPDALPVVELIGFLGWRPTVIDHRSHYAQPARFPHAEAVLDGGAATLVSLLRNDRTDVDGAFQAAIIMSHHFPSDISYARALGASDIGYVGLLGPVSRRDRLLTELGGEARRLAPRLHAPVGLDLGAATPEAIALSIVAEIHGTLTGHTHMGPLGARHEPAPNPAARP